MRLRSALDSFLALTSSTALGLVALLFTGCAGGPTQWYAGPARTPEEVALITSSTHAKITKLDGREVHGGSYEVLPGEHTIHVKVVFLPDEISGAPTGARETCVADARFIAGPGQHYEIVRISGQGQLGDRLDGVDYDSDWGVVLQNTTSGEVLSEAMSEMNCGAS